VARPVGSLLASLVAPLLCIASQAWRPGVTCSVNFRVCKKLNHLMEMSMLRNFVYICTTVACFNMVSDVTLLAPC